MQAEPSCSERFLTESSRGRCLVLAIGRLISDLLMENFIDYDDLQYMIHMYYM